MENDVRKGLIIMPMKLVSFFMAVIAMIMNVMAPVVSPAPAPLDGGERVQYGESYNQVYDIYVPSDAKGDVDVLLVIHGGGWVFYDQTQYAEKLKTACDEHGLVAVGMDYRKLQNNATAFDMLDDVEATVESVKDYLLERGLTAHKMALAGHSSGSHLSALYAYQHYNDSPIEIGFITLGSCPASFFDSNTEKLLPVKAISCGLISVLTGESINLLNLKDKTDAVNSITALSMVNPNVPPTLIVHGKKDKSVSYENAEKLESALKENGVYCELITYENSDHLLQEDAAEMDSVTVSEFYRFVSEFL